MDPARDAAMLAAVRQDVPPPAPSGSGTIDTVEFLLSLAGAWPAAPDPRSVGGLDALARKLSVAREILAAYGPGWSRPASPEPLAPPAWALLVAVLVAYARDDRPDDPDTRGVALKRLNAAFTALDLGAARGQIPRRLALAAWTQERLAALVEA